MDESKAYVIANPTSGKGRVKNYWETLIRPELEKIWPGFNHEFTRYPGHATELTRKVLHEKCETLVVLGGDGTLNECVNGFFANGKPIFPSARLVILPFGSGGDFLRTLNSPRHWRKVLHAVSQWHDRAVDVGKIEFDDSRFEPRYFLNVADAGVVADVMRSVNALSRTYPSPLRYLWGSYRGFSHYQDIRAKIVFDDSESVTENLTSLTVANGKYFGHGMQPAPHADPSDGLFDVTILKNVGTFVFFKEILPRLYAGTAPEKSPFHVIRRCHKVRIENLQPEKKLFFEMDGETYGEGHANFMVLPGALKILAPS